MKRDKTDVLRVRTTRDESIPTARSDAHIDMSSIKRKPIAYLPALFVVIDNAFD